MAKSTFVALKNMAKLEVGTQTILSLRNEQFYL